MYLLSVLIYFFVKFSHDIPINTQIWKYPDISQDSNFPKMVSVTMICMHIKYFAWHSAIQAFRSLGMNSVDSYPDPEPNFIIPCNGPRLTLEFELKKKKGPNHGPVLNFFSQDLLVFGYPETSFIPAIYWHVRKCSKVFVQLHKNSYQYWYEEL